MTRPGPGANSRPVALEAYALTISLKVWLSDDIDETRCATVLTDSRIFGNICLDSASFYELTNTFLESSNHF